VPQPRSKTRRKRNGRPRNVFVEQRPHVSFADRLLLRHGAKPGELDAHAERILGLAGERGSQGGDGTFVVARRKPRPPEHRMGRGKARHELQHLRGEIGGGRVIALVIGGLRVAAVGEEIAGGAEHGREHRG
jgi:hypothetical protein